MTLHTIRKTLLISVLTTGLLGCGHISAVERQPTMHKALDALLVAERALMNASRDKGGHRAEALRLVRAAIVETRRGIRYDNRH